MYRSWNRLCWPCVLGSLLALSACTGPGGKHLSAGRSESGAVSVGTPGSGATPAPGGIEQAGSLTGSGPGSGPGGEESRDVRQPLSAAESTMISNLSDVVAQIFQPVRTTVQINRNDNDPVMQYFISVLAGKGFGIQRVSADQGANYLSYSLTNNASEPTRLSLSVGAVRVSRDYEVERDRVTPVSKVRLAGTRVPVTVVDAESGRFGVRDSSLSDAVYVASLSLDEQAPVISLITPELVNRVSTQGTSAPSLQALNSSRIEVNNLFYSNQSTFASILDDYQRVQRQIIIFGNDSMILGDTNKQLIDQFVETRFRPGDVISLVGCSNGPTVLDIGNEGLALGRARRVTEALLARGVARDRILDEGCWAPTSVGDRFPSRGVVMELWRSKA